MGDLDDLFGPTPIGPRPTHPDFQKLVHLVLEHDGKTEDPDYDIDADLAAICDTESISYMALQRGFRMAGLMGIDPIANPGVAVKLASLWIDAWMLGSAWAKQEA